MASTSISPGAASNVDMSFINDLYEEIENKPPAIEARKLLIQQCMEAGWGDAARGAVQELLQLSPNDEDAKSWVAVLSKEGPKELSPKPVTSIVPPPLLTRDLESEKHELLQGYAKLRSEAKKLEREIQLLRNLAQLNCEQAIGEDCKSNQEISEPPEEKTREKTAFSRFETHIQDLAAMIDGRISTALRVQKPKSARSVARDMLLDSSRAMDIAVADLEVMAQWLRSSSQASQLDDDGVREALVKRVRTMTTVLPEGMEIHASTAWMHVEHEVLGRKYVCTETMYGDPVADIPRANFLVTEDGYPWDMEELAQAITSNGGVMRNPLSRQMFTTNDIRAIVQHPLGKRLAALQVEQEKLSQGVRPQTIEEMEKMATVLLADMSSDQMESRQVVDAFMAYVATLPDMEQEALDGLRVPAKDSHTGQGYDTSIGEAVRDAKANKVCFHKTGDFVRQAANHLRKQL
jgi:hypothetical protein